MTDNFDASELDLVTKTLSISQEYLSKNQLWKSLSDKMSKTSFKAILLYLEKSNKIIYDKDDTIVWIVADNPKLKKLLKTSTQLR